MGKILGHRRHRNTAGYAHLDDAHLVDVAEKVGCLIAKAMDAAKYYGIETVTTLADATASNGFLTCHRTQVTSISTMRAGESFSGHGFDSTSTRADRRRGTKLLLASIR